MDMNKKGILEALNNAERDYKEEKLKLSLMKAEFALNIDWDKVNKHRVEHGKPKITNKENREFYFKSHFEEDDKNLLNLELAYNSLKREFRLIEVSE